MSQPNERWWQSFVSADDSTANHAWQLSWLADAWSRAWWMVAMMHRYGSRECLDAKATADMWKTLAQRWTTAAIEREKAEVVVEGQVVS